MAKQPNRTGFDKWYQESGFEGGYVEGLRLWNYQQAKIDKLYAALRLAHNRLHFKDKGYHDSKNYLQIYEALEETK